MLHKITTKMGPPVKVKNQLKKPLRYFTKKDKSQKSLVVLLCN